MMDSEHNKEKNPSKKAKSVSFSSSVGDISSDTVNSQDVDIPKTNSPLWPNPIHYLLIINALYSKGLTLDPLGLMLAGIPILVLAQCFYGFVLITSSKNTYQGRTIKDNAPLVVITATVASLLLANIVFVMVILMGAPLAKLVTETYVLSIHIALLAIQPVLVLFRLEYGQLRKFFTTDKVYSEVLSNTVLCSSFFALLGAWLGVIPIPLDWDRPWQQWPCTILTGAYIGGFIGHNVATIRSLLF
ncbi:hypothetical protein FT663_05468 [Candidozyma haemuli var. vulneris]|nr:hypothetical protein FT663_05468 [[Candida] haemuloni var. vulneris]KAF3987154.1 hypothetical protein FT662_04172 [[Candida] haemuloni var. vulneris]